MALLPRKKNLPISRRFSFSITRLSIAIEPVRELELMMRFFGVFFGQQGRRQRRPQVLHGSRLLFRSVAPGDAQRHGAHAEGQRTQGIVFFSCVLIVFYCYYFTDIIEPHCAPFGRRSFRDFVSRRVLCDCSLRVTRRLWFGLC